MKNTLKNLAMILVVSLLLLFAVGCDMSSIFEEIYQPEMETVELNLDSFAPSDVGDTERQPESTARDTERQPESTERDTESVQIPEFLLFVEKGVVIKNHNTDLQVFNESTQDYRVHLGIDIETMANAPVFAAADGVVSKIWEDELMGHCIAIEHEGGFVTYYKNLTSEPFGDIKEGSKVIRGSRIATVGESALIEVADPPHLHFEMTHNGEAIDPLKYITLSTFAKG